MFNYKKLAKSSSKPFFFLSLLLVTALMFTACEGFDQGAGETGVVGQEGVLEDEPVVEEEGVLEDEPVVEEGVVEEEPLAEEEGVVEEEPMVEEEGVLEEQTAGQFALISAAELIGDDVLNSAMQDWGIVEDVIFGMAADTSDYVVLELNEDLLNIAADDAATLIPLSALSPSVEEDAFFLNPDITGDMLLNAPLFEEDSFLGLNDPTWDDETFNYWTDQGILETGMIETEEIAAADGPTFVRATNLMGETVSVTTVAGDDVGLIENVIVSVAPDAVTYAVISSNVVGVADQDFVVPLERLDFSQLVEGNIIFDEDLTAFDEAPLFDQEIVTSPGIITDPAWDDPYVDFWGAEDVAATPGVGQEAVGGFAFIKADELIGDDILNADMQDLGIVQDVIIGLTPNSSDYVVLELNDELFNTLTTDVVTLIPLSALSPSAEEDAFFLSSDVSGQMLLNAPLFTQDSFLGLDDLTWDDELFGYWQNEGIIGSGFIQAEQTAGMTGPAFMQASQLTAGLGIISPTQEDTGEIESVILGMLPNTSDYAVMSFSEWYEFFEEEQFAVPLSRLDFSQLAQGNVILDADQAMLEQSPSINDNAFTGAAADETWDDDIASFWGVEDAVGMQ